VGSSFRCLPEFSFLFVRSNLGNRSKTGQEVNLLLQHEKANICLQDVDPYKPSSVIMLLAHMYYALL
jgi:hypothetical protein